MQDIQPKTLRKEDFWDRGLEEDYLLLRRRVAFLAVFRRVVFLRFGAALRAVFLRAGRRFAVFFAALRRVVRRFVVFFAALRRVDFRVVFLRFGAALRAVFLRAGRRFAVLRAEDLRARFLAAIYMVRVIAYNSTALFSLQYNQ